MITARKYDKYLLSKTDTRGISRRYFYFFQIPGTVSPAEAYGHGFNGRRPLDGERDVNRMRTPSLVSVPVSPPKPHSSDIWRSVACTTFISASFFAVFVVSVVRRAQPNARVSYYGRPTPRTMTKEPC